jgi:hypothetical protein
MTWLKPSHRIPHIDFRLVCESFCACIVAVFLLTVPGFGQQSSPPIPDATHPGWVVIPVDEYQDLRAHAFPSQQAPEPPPVDATLTRVDYELNIARDLATGRATLTVDVLKDGWVRVPIPSGLLVREPRLDGKLVSLVSGGAGKSNELFAVLAHPGRAVLLLDVALPVSASAGEERISLPSTSSGVTRASVQLPRPDVDVKLSGGLLAEKSITGAESKWLAYARGNEPLVFTWRRKMEDHHVALPLRQRGSLTQLTSLGEDATSLYAEVNLEVLQGAAREARIQLPENMTVNQVSGAMVADWEVKASELLVTFLEPVEQSARFVITGETRTAREGHIDISLLRLLNTERESGGGVAVEVLGAGEIKDLKSQGLENADATELGEYVAGRQSPSMVAFRFRSGDASVARSLSVDIARYAQQAVLMANVEEARYRVLLTKEGKMLVQAQYAIRNNQRNFLKINLPADAVIWSASLAGKPVRPGQAADGSLLLPLEKTRAGEDAPGFVLEIFYLVREPAWSDKGKATLTLPALDLPVSRTGLLLYHPPLFKVTGEPGTFRMETYEAPVSDAFRPAVVEVGMSAGIMLDGADGRERLQQFSKLNDPVATQNPATQTLVENFKNKSLGGRGAKVLPIRPAFPAFGPSVFFVSELTAENHAPVLDLNYQREKKEGSR